jgi:periplasmic protein CpxP/Spy
MRKISVISLLFLCVGIAGTVTCSYVANAQAPARQAQGQGRVQKMMDRLTTYLSLTPDQVSKITPIVQADLPKMMQIRNDSTLTDDQKKAQMVQLRKSEHEQIAPFLTPAQIVKMKALRQQMRARQ